MIVAVATVAASIVLFPVDTVVAEDDIIVGIISLLWLILLY